MLMVYNICPIAKPRMVHGDKWKKRPATNRYWNFCDLCRMRKINLPCCRGHVTFVLPMPESWSEKKKSQLEGLAHRNKPDLDNLIKALGDAIYKNDSGIWDIHATKLWGREGKIIIETSDELGRRGNG